MTCGQRHQRGRPDIAQDGGRQQASGTGVLILKHSKVFGPADRGRRIAVG